jgi:hypothetical protein
VAAPVAEAFFGGMTKVMLAEGVHSSRNGSEFIGGGANVGDLFSNAMN